MSSASVTHDFSNGTIGDADQVDQNFSDIVNFLNSHVVHKGETALEAKTGSPGLKMQYGDDTIGVTSAAAVFTKAVSFPVAFASIPVVFVASGQGTGGSKIGWVGVSDSSVTTTGFTFVWRSTDLNNPAGSATYDWYWLAIGT
jgi:hypothetical protein